MLISLISWPWSLFNQTHYVCGRQGYGAQRCPVLVQNMLPYMTKELFKWDSGDRTSDGGRFSRWVPSDHMSLKAEDFLCHRSVREMRWKRGGVNVSVKSCWWLWSWREGVMTRGMRVASDPVEWAQLEASNGTGTSALQLQGNEFWPQAAIARGPTLPWSFWKGTQLWCYLQFNLEGPQNISELWNNTFMF